MRYQILEYSKTLRDDGTFRLDAEHYQQEFLVNQEKLAKFGSKPLSEYIAHPIMTGHTPSMQVDSYYGGKIKLVKTDNLREFKINGGFKDYLSESGNSMIKRSALKAGDLILTIIGATHKIVGRAALVQHKDLPANINQNIALVRLKDGESPEFFSAYLNSKFGKHNLWYLSRQTEQVNLNCREIEKLLVPEVSDELQIGIETAYKKAVEFESNSNMIFSSAQEILLADLGLANWHPKHQLSFVKKYSETDVADRMDAEYFQPKYDEIVNAIQRYHGGWDTLERLVKLRDGNFTPVAEAEYKYLELSNIAGNGEITDCMFEKGKDLPSRARRKVATGDVIVSSIEGSLSSIAVIGKSYDQALCSTGFYVASSEFFNSETLLVLLKSVVGQLQLKKGCSGTILTAINKDELSKVVLPKVDEDIQWQIKQKVAESFDLRKQSKHLLECTKRAVEIAIEQKEEAAIKWLSELTKS